jgi:hypothetical protein
LILEVLNLSLINTGNLKKLGAYRYAPPVRNSVQSICEYLEYIRACMEDIIAVNAVVL